MKLSVGEARALIEQVMTGLGHDAHDAAVIADHLMDTELRGLNYGGLARAVSIAERLSKIDRRRPLQIERETPVSARLDGGDQIGYVVAHRATRMAIDKAKASGIAVVGANNTWYTGMLSYYAEMAAAEGLVTVIASNASPWVAPHGATEGRFGTNPICFGFPSSDRPVIWDIGTSAIIHAEVTLSRRLGLELPEGVAFDREGNPTRDPAAALEGAFAPWGGHKGSGLAIVVHLLGMLAGSPVVPPDLAEFGFLIVAIDPAILTSAEQWRKDVAAYSEWVRAARPVPGGSPVRMPFDRSREDRQKRLTEDAVEVPDTILEALRPLASRAASS
ncbi:MAG TPA: Ldh family oxidoreductase [Microvirga sp.]|nr:Ldh family oxidoreductase [Microvirga sp.]